MADAKETPAKEPKVVTAAKAAKPAKREVKYVAAVKFRDIETGRVYAEGEAYENADPARIKALSTKANKSGKALIKRAN